MINYTVNMGTKVLHSCDTEQQAWEYIEAKDLYGIACIVNHNQSPQSVADWMGADEYDLQSVVRDYAMRMEG